MTGDMPVLRFGTPWACVVRCEVARAIRWYLERMKTRVALFGVVTLVVVVVALLLNEPEPESTAPTPPSADAPLSAPRPEPIAQAATRPAKPAAVIAPVAAPVGSAPAFPAMLQLQPSAWLPPERTDRVFDLNQDSHVEPDEQERAAELLERAHQFATNRSVDGTYPILKPAFRGEGRLFRAMDSDGDGALTEREFLAFEADSIRQLRRFDQNADGALSKAEFGHLDSRFDFLDEDHDGELYAWEITLMRGRGKW